MRRFHQPSYSISTVIAKVEKEVHTYEQPETLYLLVGLWEGGGFLGTERSGKGLGKLAGI